MESRNEGTFIEWQDDRYSTDIERFDDQHKRLFKLLNDLHTAMEEGHSEETVGEILRELERYTEYHFGDEEEFMQDCGYAMDCADCFYNHRDVHEEFAEKVSELREKHENGEYITMEVLMFVRDWLDSHIAGVNQDQNYGDYYDEEVSDDYEYRPGKLNRARGTEEARPEESPDVVSSADTSVSLGSDVHRGPDLSVPDGPLAAWFDDLVDAYGDRTIARIRTESSFTERTFREFYARARSVAAGLLAAGLDPGDRLAIQAPSSYEWAVVDVACHLAGLVSVPIYPQFDDDRTVAVAELADVDATVLDPEVARTDHRALGTVFDVESLPTAEPKSLPGFDAGMDDVATIVFEPDTTDVPDGCVLTHENLLAATATLSESLPLDPGATGTCFLPLAHSYQRVAAYYLWANGAAAAYLRADSLVTDLAAVRPAVLVGIPQVYRRLYDEMQDRIESMGRLKRQLADGVAREYGKAMSDGRDASALKHSAADSLVFSTLREEFGLDALEYAISGTSRRLDTDLLYFFWGCDVPVSELYGTTALGGVGTLNRYRSFQTESVGFPMPGTEIALADDGEVLFRGPNVMESYLAGAGASDDLRDGWYCSGEVGEFDDAGSLEITERA